MVLSDKVYSPQVFLEKMTGKCYAFDSSVDDDIKEIERILNCHSYPLSSNETMLFDLVLVECMVWNTQTNEYEKVYRWFEADKTIIW